MGLDIGFYTQDEEGILDLRNHHWIFRQLLEEPHETIEPYSDFYVTADMIESVLDTVETEMEEAGLPLPDLASHLPKTEADMLEGLPRYFCDAEPEDWTAALPLYRLLLTRLLAVTEEEGDLICGWSA